MDTKQMDRLILAVYRVAQQSAVNNMMLMDHLPEEAQAITDKLLSGLVEVLAPEVTEAKAATQEGA